MKVQLYPIQDSSIQYESSQEPQVDPLTKIIDDFFQKDIDKSKNTDYNNYIK